MKLDMQHKHILRLTQRGRGEDGWAKVNKSLYKTLSENMPAALINVEPTDEGGRARLTDEGENVLRAMEWL